MAVASSIGDTEVTSFTNIIDVSDSIVEVFTKMYQNPSKVCRKSLFS